MYHVAYKTPYHTQTYSPTPNTPIHTVHTHRSESVALSDLERLQRQFNPNAQLERESADRVSGTPTREPDPALAARLLVLRDLNFGTYNCSVLWCSVWCGVMLLGSVS